MEKTIINYNGKKGFLLGEYNGEKLYLLEASWDCNWYWGFGYIETKSSHSHYNNFVWHEKDGKFIYHINDIKDFKSVLSDNEAWQLSDLMKTFYTLKATAELYHIGNSHFTKTSVNLKNIKKEKNINKKELPKIFEAIYNLLKP